MQIITLILSFAGIALGLYNTRTQYLDKNSNNVIKLLNEIDNIVDNIEDCAIKYWISENDNDVVSIQLNKLIHRLSLKMNSSENILWPDYKNDCKSLRQKCTSGDFQTTRKTSCKVTDKKITEKTEITKAFHTKIETSLPKGI